MDKKEIINYFRSNIFESYSAYLCWKVIYGSRSIGIVTESMAHHYSTIQSFHSEFFVTAERAFLIQFVILSLHSLDPDTRSFSLYKVDKTATIFFKESNKKVLDTLFDLRNKLFAHKDMKDNSQYKIPSFNELDDFYRKLIEFYNKLSKAVEDSSTVFMNAEIVILDIENLFMNLYRGEHTRVHQKQVDYSWEQAKNKISDVVNTLY